MKDNILFQKAMAEFFKTLPVSQYGLSEDPNGTTISWEKITIGVDKYRVTIITEEVVEDLHALLERALQDENYELANKLTEKIEEIKNRNNESI